MNLAGRVPWISLARPMIVDFAVLWRGNFLHAVFMLTPDVGGWWLRPAANWPRWMRSKWMAAGDASCVPLGL